MAKDKGKKDKGGKPEKSKKGGDSEEYGKPSEAPSGGDWKLADDDNLGRLLLFTPLREETVKGFEDEDTRIIVADVVVINEKKPAKSEEHTEVWVFQKWVQGALRGFIGEKRVLGRLGKDKAKGKGKNAAWVLEDASKADIELAREYRASVDPFDQKTGKKKAKPEKDEKPAKGKKSKKK